MTDNFNFSILEMRFLLNLARANFCVKVKPFLEVSCRMCYFLKPFLKRTMIKYKELSTKLL